MLSIEHLKKSYQLRPVLKDITFTLEDGYTVGVFGENGVGKTTLLRIIARMSSCDEGDIRFNGNSLLKGSAVNRSGILYIGHQPNLYPILTAEENLKFAAHLHRSNPSDEDLLDVLDQVGLIHQRWDPIRYYSRGMLQRLALAKALILPWTLLLMDEPFSGLDENGISLLEVFIRQWQGEQKSMIIVSHQRSWLEEFCSKILFLSNGIISES